MNGTDNMSARYSYENARAIFYEALRDKFSVGDDGDRKCEQWVNSLKLTQGEIWLEVELNNVNNIFTFGVTPNQQNSNNVVFKTEQRLPLQDSLLATEMHMFVFRPVTSDGTPSQTGLYGPLRTYGNTVDFSAGAALGLDTVLYSHGGFTMKVNSDVKQVYRGLQNFWYKPQTQQTAALGAGSPGDQIRPVEDAGATLEPNLVFIGSSNSIPQIVLPGNIATVDSFTRVRLVFSGPYAQNSTVVN